MRTDGRPQLAATAATVYVLSITKMEGAYTSQRRTTPALCQHVSHLCQPIAFFLLRSPQNCSHCSPLLPPVLNMVLIQNHRRSLALAHAWPHRPSESSVARPSTTPCCRSVEPPLHLLTGQIGTTFTREREARGEREDGGLTLTYAA